MAKLSAYAHNIHKAASMSRRGKSGVQSIKFHTWVERNHYGKGGTYEAGSSGVYVAQTCIGEAGKAKNRRCAIGRANSPSVAIKRSLIAIAGKLIHKR